MADMTEWMSKESKDCSPLISVKGFKNQILKEFSLEELDRERCELSYRKLSESMGISAETVTELDEVCSPANLKGEIEPCNLNHVDIYNDEMPVGVQLSSLRLLKERKGKLTHFKKEINYVIKETRAKHQASEHRAVEKVEVVLSVAIYHPKLVNKVQEFLVLCGQPLTSLRDKIHCSADHIVPGDHSDNPGLSLMAPCRDICKSGFFYFENIFYNDMRDGLCRDYSRTIFDWAKDSDESWSTKIKTATTKKMEDTTFETLTVRLGYPYLYCHQGNCEHIVIFTDLRLVHVDDSDNAIDYPVQIFRHRCRRRRCRVCNIYTAKWITKNDILASEDPSFFCDKCFKSLHYTADNQKICDFEAYPYMGFSNW